MKTSGKWTIVCVYIIGIFVITPYLPQLIQAATSRWSRLDVSRFVLGVEIAIAFLILILALEFLIHRRKKSALFLVSVGGIFLLSFVIYQFIPNPYEFTHLPEYAILSMLIIRALGKEKVRSKSAEKEEKLKSVIIKNSYFLSAMATGIIGTGDEIYQYFLPNRFFTLYDISLNILGGILGLLIYWRIRK
ncbi:hypothetical protein LCGC14_1100050 [marine sediment metagenome]|uniref:VanZ-like domain-containing protein n=1 Tax=marine sediment metagenome TaxID=412755 RepID=A0A0F9MEB3_9ZZZZ|nr:hypothetical protein [Candidatus Aminicenantes bacterium]